MKYHLRPIMLNAWKIYRQHQEQGVSFSEALHRAWLAAKAEKINNTRIETAQNAANVTEPVNTWARWKEL